MGLLQGLGDVFLDRKVIRVQLDIEDYNKFQKVCCHLALGEQETIEEMIRDYYRGLEELNDKKRISGIRQEDE